MSVAVAAANEAARPGPVRARLRQQELACTERNLALLIHMSPLGALLFWPVIAAPLVIWLIRKEDSAFIDDHGREMVNAIISFFIYNLVAMVTVIGLVALPVLYVVAIVNVVRGAVAAKHGEYFRYPMTIRLLG